ncbi:Sapep family Mn(2+)-dependent dipeptidase [Caproiciproducens galactitolivorans]|uniref:Sapep family Mn(2+)-dependent dipeptidase n=1 Tax=Caproiciproducens galactitolivorans TaxID=642589 RepID=A0ABT4BV66_9FIRM|nr:Sapep family Mn(2+)-dependent dipeptidase [Caproiciproducens galactitolivorans]MCY1713978.1 Sapep family Mn(2+)-dependent dipeptidase [Caproiciproducens galactitolivorans]
MRFGSKILNYREDIIKDLAELVAIPSVQGKPEEGMPFGREVAKAMDSILNMADRMGFATKNIGGYAGHAEYGEGDEVAAVVAHMDIVPEGEGWDTDPFTLTKKGNLYFGRGTADDKGAAIVALYCLKALKDENIKGNRRLRVIFGAGEETSSNDLEMYLKSEQMPVMAFTPDSDYGICNREKGIMRFTISAKKEHSVIKEFTAGTVVNAVPSKAIAEVVCSEETYRKLQDAAKNAAGDFEIEKTTDGAKITSVGKASHAMQPQEGFNSATHLMKLLGVVFKEEELGSLVRFVNTKVGTELHGESLGVSQQDKESGPLTFNIGLVNIHDGEASVGVDIRYPVTADGEKIFSKIAEQAAEFGLASQLNNDTKPLFLPESSPFISLLQDSYAEITGKPADVYATGGGTYARAFKGRAVAFGPFFPDEPDRRLHNTNENIDIDRFMVHAQICLEAMYRMFTK